MKAYQAPITPLYMKCFLRRVSFLLIILLPGLTARSHPDHTDSILLELNDYLMAIQVMRTYDPEAESLFETWQILSEESWYIRQLTDGRDLAINASEVMDQIAYTRNLRKKLLLNCRAYFADIMELDPGIVFTVENEIEVDWKNTPVKVPTNQSRVVLIKIENKRTSATRLIMKADSNDQLLFWNKIFDLLPGGMRYSFVIIAPLEEGSISNTISLEDTLGNTNKVVVTATGTAATDRYTLEPGEDIYKVALPGSTWGSTWAVEGDYFPDSHITFDIKDAASGKPLAARVEVSDSDGWTYWSPLRGPTYAVNRESNGWTTTLWKFQPGPYFYVDGNASLGVEPDFKTVGIYHGFEYRTITMPIPENGMVDVSLERWINMPERGWYSGHTHIHTTDAGMPVQFTRHWPMVSKAEDIHLSGILTLKGEWQTHAIYANEYPMGKRERFSTPDHIITYGQEYRSNPYGHLAFLGLNYLIQPISSGALGELGGPDYPSNATILDEAISQGAVTIGAHFGNFISEGLQIKTPWPSTGFEMPVDVALGKMQLAEVYGAGGQLQIWYDLLNCGFKIPATAGPDWAIKDTPRVYVHLGEEDFNQLNWLSGLKKGRSFITTGPMLFFKVNKQLAGSEISLQEGSKPLRIEANALAPDQKLEVELIFNGKVIASGINLRMELHLEDSGWLAARCEGAHTNPVYINFAGRPAGYAKPAEKFIKITDRLLEWVNNKGLFYSEKQKVEVKAVLTQGIGVFQDVAFRARQLGRIEP